METITIGWCQKTIYPTIGINDPHIKYNYIEIYFREYVTTHLKVDPMTSQEIFEIVMNEINAGWSLANAQGLNINKCLLSQPVKMQFMEYSAKMDNPRCVELWLVLQENPDGKTGCMIVFNEQRNRFGLAISDAPDKPAIILGYYGSFLDTLLGM
jgi:hypothetical protein